MTQDLLYGFSKEQLKDFDLEQALSTLNISYKVQLPNGLSPPEANTPSTLSNGSSEAFGSGLEGEVESAGRRRSSIPVEAKLNGISIHTVDEGLEDNPEARTFRADSIKIMPIAIVGMSCRFPGDVNNIGDFWKLCSEGIVDAWSEVPQDRFNVNAFYHPVAERPQSGSIHLSNRIVEANVLTDKCQIWTLPKERTI